MVSPEDVIEIYQKLSSLGIRAWLTGGWGIDALLGEQTRPHKDLDVLVLLDDILHVRELLEKAGFVLKELWSENRMAKDSSGNQTATAFVLRDPKERELDLHALIIDEYGNGIPAWDEADDFIFKPEDLAGRGRIAGQAVYCISAKSQVICHTGYELPDQQLRDLDLLHKKWGQFGDKLDESQASFL